METGPDKETSRRVRPWRWHCRPSTSPSSRRSRIIGGSLLGPRSRILHAPPYRLAPRPCGERCRVHSGLQTSKPPVLLRILCPLIPGVFAHELRQKQCEYAPYTLSTNFLTVAVQPQGLYFSATGGTGIDR